VRLRRPLLMLVLGAIVVTVALALYAVLLPGFGDVQGKVLATSACVTGASLLVLACLPAWERGLARLAPAVGAGATLAGLALIVVAIWEEPSQDGYWKSVGTFLLVGGWGTLVSLLALAELAPRYRWTFLAAAGLALLLTAIAVVAMWSAPSSGLFERLAAGVAVLTAAFVVVVPVLSRASRGELEADA
jgi:hypothetical protein